MSFSDESKWLENIKVGDKVIISTTGFMGGRRIRKVVRLTKTQIILENTEKFRRDVGRSISGDIWNSSYLQEATAEEVTKIETAYKKAVLIKKIEDNFKNFKNLDIDALENVVKLLDIK